MSAPAVSYRWVTPIALRLTDPTEPAPKGRTMQLLAVTVVTLAVIGGLGWLGQPPSAALPAQTTVVRVGAGETVWDVARRVAPESDPREVVARIRQLNGMTGSAVWPGRQLQVPDGTGAGSDRVAGRWGG